MVALPAQQPQRMTPQEFLTWEETQELRYEYINGEIVAMTGGTIPHNDLAVNLLLLLAPHVKSRGSRINVADVKVKMRQRFRYPDLVVTCDDRDKTATKLFQYPTLIVEVLSPGTESIDRDEKFQEYRSIPTLQEYVLISSDRIYIEVFRRSHDRIWLYESYETGEIVVLASVEFECAIDRLYDGITLPKIVDLEEIEDETETE
jgi:Uma2 family endonuclease